MIAGTHPLPTGGFTLSSNFEVGTSGVYGYAEINYSASSSTEFFYGKTSSTLGNTPAQPWGTFGKSGGTSGFRATDNFPGQILEFGLDLTYMGIDPYQFKTVDTGDWCNPSFGSVMMKSRTSSSFSSALKDFIGPASFVLPPISVDADATSGLDCISTNACAVVTNRTGNNRNNWYEWVNTNNPGAVVDTGVVFCTATPGNYKVYAMRGDGCRRVDSTIITVAQDKRQPIATATVFDTLVVNAVYNVQLFGGSQYLTDSVMALDSAAFGPSQGLQYSWVGTSPGSIEFVTTTNQNPIVSDSGFYRLIVTEPRNGCKDTALALVVMLPVSWGDFYCTNLNNGTVALNWATLSEKDVDKFEVQKLKNNIFETVGVVDATGNSNWPVNYHFTDKISNESSRIFYRIKMVAENGSVEYSDVCETITGASTHVNEGLQLYPNPADQQVEISLSEPTQADVNFLMFDVLGRQLKSAVIAAGESSVTVNVANLTPGVYWLRTGESKNHSSVIFIKK